MVRPNLWRTFALAVAVASLASAFYFERFLIEQKELKEITITIKKRPTNRLKLWLDRCNRNFERNSFNHNVCVNRGLGI